MGFNNIVLYHSVALAFSAIRLLQDAKIFRMEEVTRFQDEKDERECLVCVDICLNYCFFIYEVFVKC